jgi:hypothetical protein
MLADVFGASSCIQVFFNDGFAITVLIQLDVETPELMNSAAKVPVAIAQELKLKSLAKLLLKGLHFDWICTVVQHIIHVVQ